MLPTHTHTYMQRPYITALGCVQPPGGDMLLLLFLMLLLLLLLSQEGAARPEIIAEVASSLADMLYATNKMDEAKEALQVSVCCRRGVGGQQSGGWGDLGVWGMKGNLSVFWQPCIQSMQARMCTREGMKRFARLLHHAHVALSFGFCKFGWLSQPIRYVFASVYSEHASKDQAIDNDHSRGSLPLLYIQG